MDIQDNVEVSVFYVIDSLYDPMTLILDSMEMLYESQVVAGPLPKDGNNWSPVGWHQLENPNE